MNFGVVFPRTLIIFPRDPDLCKGSKSDQYGDLHFSEHYDLYSSNSTDYKRHTCTRSVSLTWI